VSLTLSEIRPEERRALALAWAYFFFLLAGYYIIRPLREQMGVAGGVRNLAWLYTGSLTAMLLLHAPFAALVARVPRRRFLAVSYRFFIVNLIGFFLVLRMTPPAYEVWVGRVFFVWTSVFNLFVISLFWAVTVDVFTPEQGKRLFGIIAVGGTLGGAAGAGLTALLAKPLGPVQLLLLSAALLELALRCALALTRDAPTPAGGERRPVPEAPIGGGTLAGIAAVFRSPYLLGICAYLLLYTLGSTVLYFDQARLAAGHFSDAAARTGFFARLDFGVNVLAALTQVFLTAGVLRALGVALTLTILPVLSLARFAVLGLMPPLGVFVVFQVLRRATEFAIGKPAREVLFTVVSREDKYKAKNFVDTFVYRAGDQVAAWSYTGLAAAGLGMTAISWVMVPMAAGWAAIAYWLGRRQTAYAARAPVASAA
jgi:AAA family ATP:ADP antiporter